MHTSPVSNTASSISKKYMSRLSTLIEVPKLFLVSMRMESLPPKQLILAKHHMTQQVYAHRVRVISDYMIVRGLELAIQGELEEITKLYEYDGSPEFCQRYLKYDDDRVMDVLMHCELEAPRSIYQRLHERRLYKQLVRMPLTERQTPDPIRRSRYIDLSDETKIDLQAAIADYLHCEPWEIIIEVKNVKKSSVPRWGDDKSRGPF